MDKSKTRKLIEHLKNKTSTRRAGKSNKLIKITVKCSKPIDYSNQSNTSHRYISKSIKNSYY